MTYHDRLGNPMTVIDLGDGRVQLKSTVTDETYVFNKIALGL